MLISLYTKAIKMCVYIYVCVCVCVISHYGLLQDIE